MKDCRSASCIWTSFNDKKQMKWCDKKDQPLTAAQFFMQDDDLDRCPDFKPRFPDRTVKVKNHLIEASQKELSIFLGE